MVSYARIKKRREQDIMKHFVYSLISVLCFPAVIVIQHFVQDKTTEAGLAGLVTGICLTCLIGE